MKYGGTKVDSTEPHTAQAHMRRQWGMSVLTRWVFGAAMTCRAFTAVQLLLGVTWRQFVASNARWAMLLQLSTAGKQHEEVSAVCGVAKLSTWCFVAARPVPTAFCTARLCVLQCEFTFFFDVLLLLTAAISSRALVKHIV